MTSTKSPHSTGVLINIGPAMIHDSDDTNAVTLMAEILKRTKLNSSVVAGADEDGVITFAKEMSARSLFAWPVQITVAGARFRVGRWSQQTQSPLDLNHRCGRPGLEAAVVAAAASGGATT
jgi:hypothetical protein